MQAHRPDGQRFSVSDVVARPTYHRRKQQRKPLSKDDSEKLWQIARVYVEAMRHYHDSDDAAAFLFRPHPLLEKRRHPARYRHRIVGPDAAL